MRTLSFSSCSSTFWIYLFHHKIHPLLFYIANIYKILTHNSIPHELVPILLVYSFKFFFVVEKSKLLE
jgi:hypothetical protein